MSGMAGSFSDCLRRSTSGRGGNTWLLLLQQKTRKLSHFFIRWTGKGLAEEEDI